MRSVLVLGLAACLALRTPPAARAPIDRRAWMVSSPSMPLRVLKRLAFSSAYPGPTDYMRVLERFPLLAERGWRTGFLADPSLGFFGDPDSAEMGLRSAGNFVVVMSLLATDPAYDSHVTGVSEKHVLELARAGIAYMTRTHVTGEVPCGDGKRWGNHWQSAWWTAKMAVGAQLLWDRLAPRERLAVQRVVAHEADRHLARRAPGGEQRDTKSEENAWDTEVLAAAIALMPEHAHATGWRAKLVEFALNSLSTAADRTSARSVDGRPLREQVYTTNVHDDYTIENHGAYHTCYMICPLHSLSWGYLALASAQQSVPDAQFHHFDDVWRRLKPTFLESRFAYPAGKDWPRYAYGLSFIMPALAVLQERFGDADARAIEARRFRAFEEEQRSNGDGTFFGKRFTRNVMMDRMLEYETDCYANLAAAYLLHRLAGWALPRPPESATLGAHLSARHISAEAGLAWVRAPRLFASFAWRRLDGPRPMALFIPEGMDSAAEWGTGNLLGRVEVEGVDAARTMTQGAIAPEGDGFRAAGRLVYHARGGGPAFTNTVRFLVRPERGAAEVESTFTADADVTVSAIEGLRLHVVNDRFNGFRRTWRWPGGAVIERWRPPAELPDRETITVKRFGPGWVNLDNRLGIVDLSESPVAFALRSSNRRNGPWGSIRYSVLDCPLLAAGPRGVRAGETLLRSRFLLVAGDARRTAREAEAALGRK
ncbi:MAG: hypothetical protein IT208_16785 [Chthonomonadales bacterium]|nr:hypothetical protein [Chthonomonadales bacterium]